MATGDNPGMKTIRLRPGKERSLQRRHPWIFDSAIAKTAHAAKPPHIIYKRKRHHKGCSRLYDHHHPVKPNQNEHLRYPSSATLLPCPKHRPHPLLTVPSVVSTLPAPLTGMSDENMKTNRDRTTRNSRNTTNHRPPSNSAFRSRIRRNTASRSSSGISTL